LRLLYLKSLKNGGKLQLDEHIPYTAQMIATLTRHQIGTVERALEIFRQLGLVEQLDSGAFYMTDIPFFSDFKYSFKRILEYKIPSFISSSSTMESLSKKFSFSLR